MAESPLRDWARYLLIFVARVAKAGYETCIVSGAPVLGTPLAAEQGTWLAEAGEIGRSVNVLKSTDAHREFARIATERGALHFASKYGLLLAPDLQRFIPLHHEDGQGFNITARKGEPLASWFAESRALRALISLWDSANPGQYVLWQPDAVRVRYAYRLDGRPQLLKSPYRKDLVYPPRQEIETKAGRLALIDDELTDRRLPGDYGRRRWLLNRSQETIEWRDYDGFGPLRLHIFKAINGRLRGHVNPILLTPTNQLYFQPDSLLIALYLLFALEIYAGKRTAEPHCRECGRLIVGRNAKARYCDETCKSRWHEKRRKELARGDPVASPRA